MNNDCVDAVEEVLGRSLRKNETKAIDDEVRLRMRLLARQDPEAWMGLSPQDKLQAAAKAAAQAMIDNVKLKQLQVKLQIAAHDKIETTLNDAFAALPDGVKAGTKLRIVSQLAAFDSKGSKFASAETWSASINNEALGQLMDLWNSVKGFAGLFENSKGIHDLVHELHGEDTGNAAAKAGAAAWKKVTDGLRDRANASGMGIGRLNEDAWHYPQSWSQARVAGSDTDPSKALENWIAKQLPRLDRSKYLNADGSRMSDADVTHVLTSAFDSIVTDGQNKAQPGAPKMPGSTLLDHHRVLFFKDADSYLAAQGDFGDRNIWSSLTGHIRGLSRELGLVETMGPNSERTYKYFNDRALLDELRENPGSSSAIRKQHALNEAMYDYVAGHREVVNQKVADIGQAYRNLGVATKLGKVVITALGDEAGMAATAFANRIPWTETFAGEFHYLSPTSGEDRAVAAHTGLGINGAIGGLNRFGYEDMNLAGGKGFAAGAREFTGKLASAVLRSTGAEAMWDARRRSLGRVLMSYLGKNVSKFEHLEDASFDDVGVLKMKGVSDADWQVWRQASPEDWGMKHGVLTPKSIYQIPDERLAALGDPTALKRHAATMLLGHVLEESGMGVMDTGARQRAGMFLGTQAGTRAGELTRSAFLFKNFAWSMMQKHWQRAGAMPTSADTWSYAARLVTMGTVMGAVSLQLHSLVAGRDPPNMAEPRFFAEALIKGGGLGFYGDFLYDEATSNDTTLVPALLGPMASDAEQLWKVTGAAAFKASRGERTDEGANLIRFGRSEIPGMGMWYTQAAMDHILWNDLQEAASPGYLDRMQAKAYARRGTSYYWDPHDSLPKAAPDVAKAWQPERGAEQIQQIAQRLGQ